MEALSRLDTVVRDEKEGLTESMEEERKKQIFYEYTKHRRRLSRDERNL